MANELVVRTYLYGMRRRFGIGCQPMNGLMNVLEYDYKYRNILVYIRELTDEEVRDYELDRLEDSK